MSKYKIPNINNNMYIDYNVTYYVESKRLTIKPKGIVSLSNFHTNFVNVYENSRNKYDYTKFKLIYVFGDGSTLTTYNTNNTILHDYNDFIIYDLKIYIFYDEILIGKEIFTIDIQPPTPTIQFTTDIFYKNEQDNEYTWDENHSENVKISFTNYTSNASEYKWNINGVEFTTRDIPVQYYNESDFPINISLSVKNRTSEYIEQTKTIQYTSEENVPSLDNNNGTAIEISGEIIEYRLPFYPENHINFDEIVIMIDDEIIVNESVDNYIRISSSYYITGGLSSSRYIYDYIDVQNLDFEYNSIHTFKLYGKQDNVLSLIRTLRNWIHPAPSIHLTRSTQSYFNNIAHITIDIRHTFNFFRIDFGDNTHIEIPCSEFQSYIQDISEYQLDTVYTTATIDTNRYFLINDKHHYGHIIIYHQYPDVQDDYTISVEAINTIRNVSASDSIEYSHIPDVTIEKYDWKNRPMQFLHYEGHSTSHGQACVNSWNSVFNDGSYNTVSTYDFDTVPSHLIYKNAMESQIPAISRSTTGNYESYEDLIVFNSFYDGLYTHAFGRSNSFVEDRLDDYFYDNQYILVETDLMLYVRWRNGNYNSERCHFTEPTSSASSYATPKLNGYICKLLYLYGNNISKTEAIEALKHTAIPENSTILQDEHHKFHNCYKNVRCSKYGIADIDGAIAYLDNMFNKQIK